MGMQQHRYRGQRTAGWRSPLLPPCGWNIRHGCKLLYPKVDLCFDLVDAGGWTENSIPSITF